MYKNTPNNTGIGISFKTGAINTDKPIMILMARDERRFSRKYQIFSQKQLISLHHSNNSPRILTTTGNIPGGLFFEYTVRAAVCANAFKVATDTQGKPNIPQSKFVTAKIKGSRCSPQPLVRGLVSMIFLQNA